jgi:small subunit ribosomal protein S16
MLKIRLQRVGRKKVPSFRVVLTDSRNSTKSGRFLEVLGSFNQVADKKEINAERIKELIKNGAQVSTTMHNFLVSKDIIKGKKINALPKKKPIKKEEDTKPAESSAEAPKAEEAPKSEEAPKTETTA